MQVEKAIVPPTNNSSIPGIASLWKLNAIPFYLLPSYLNYNQHNIYTFFLPLCYFHPMLLLTKNFYLFNYLLALYNIMKY